VRSGLPEGPRELLRRHIDDGRLGEKSGGGFYPATASHSA
jgi:3-hydroxybutyryl-CoA dehydrogenase